MTKPLRPDRDSDPRGAIAWLTAAILVAFGLLALIVTQLLIPADARGAVTVPPVTATNPDAEGWATWYDDPTPPRLPAGVDGYAAVPSWSFGDTPYVQHLCGAGRGAITCVDVLVQDFCACGDRHGSPTIIDLSSGAFAEIADLSRGVILVRFGDRPWPTPVPDATLPPTDAGEELDAVVETPGSRYALLAILAIVLLGAMHLPWLPGRRRP